MVDIAIAINLGTTYSCVAVWKDNKVEVIRNEDGNRFTPSYVGFSKNECLVGEAAKNQASINSYNTVFGAKHLIGKRYDDINFQMDLRHFPFSVVNMDGKPKIEVQYRNKIAFFSPEQISAMILFRMKHLAELYLGTKVSKAIITVPAYFNDAQRQATRLAGSLAELDIIRIINEPTAAALTYGLNTKLCGKKNILVFDLGGGTLDVSVLTVTNGSIYEVRATSGNLRLGGEDFDNRLVSYFVKDFSNRFGKEIKNARSLGRLKIAAEKVKRCLTSGLEAAVQIERLFNDTNYSIRITRDLFNELCSDLFADTLIPVEKALKASRILKCDIHDIVLVGGSTRIPKLKMILSEFFGGKDLKCSVNPDEAIARGAAMQAAILCGVRDKDIENVLLIDAVSLSLGIETARGMMYKVIEKNTAIPCRYVKNITTLEDYQTMMTIEVFEGERTLTKDNHLLGVFELNKIVPVPRGDAKIEVVFEVDSNGILKVSAIDKSTGNSESITINNLNRLNQEQIIRMIADAKQFREEDIENKKRLEARNQLETYIYNSKRLVTENLVTLNGEERAFMFGEFKSALSWVDENVDCMSEEYDRKLSELLCRWGVNMRKLKIHLMKRRKYNSSFGEKTSDTRSTFN